MDEGLFTKHIKHIQKQNNIKKEILVYLLQKTGIHIKEKEITISKKEIILQTSSVKRTLLSQKNIQHILQEIGYTLKY